MNTLENNQLAINHFSNRYIQMVRYLNTDMAHIDDIAADLYPHSSHKQGVKYATEYIRQARKLGWCILSYKNYYVLDGGHTALMKQFDTLIKEYALDGWLNRYPFSPEAISHFVNGDLV